MLVYRLNYLTLNTFVHDQTKPAQFHQALPTDHNNGPEIMKTAVTGSAEKSFAKFYQVCQKL